MTVTTTLDRQYFDGDGSNKVFPFNFRFFTNDQIYVSLIAPDGTITPQSLTTNYTLAGALQAGGGTVTMIVAPPFTMPATRVFIQRILPQVQPTSIRNQGKFYPEIHEDAFDRLTMLIQQALAGLANALQLTFSKTGWNFQGYKGINVGAPTQPTDAATKDYVDYSSQGNNSYTDSQILRTVRGGSGEVLTQLPPASSRANKVMGFDAYGQPIGILPESGSGTELAIDLANSVDPFKGASLVMYRQPVTSSKGNTLRDKAIETVSARELQIYVGDDPSDTAMRINLALSELELSGYASKELLFLDTSDKYNIDTPIIMRNGVGLACLPGKAAVIKNIRATYDYFHSACILPGNFHPDFTEELVYLPLKFTNAGSLNVTLASPGDAAGFAPGDSVVVASDAYFLTGGFKCPKYMFLNEVLRVSGANVTLRFPIDKSFAGGMVKLDGTQPGRNGVPLFFWKDGSIRNLSFSTAGRFHGDTATLACLFEDVSVQARSYIYGNTFQHTRWVRPRGIVGSGNEHSLCSLNSTVEDYEFSFDPQSAAPANSAFFGFQENTRGFKYRKGSVDFSGYTSSTAFANFINSEGCGLDEFTITTGSGWTGSDFAFNNVSADGRVSCKGNFATWGTFNGVSRFRNVDFSGDTVAETVASNKVEQVTFNGVVTSECLRYTNVVDRNTVRLCEFPSGKPLINAASRSLALLECGISEGFSTQADPDIYTKHDIRRNRTAGYQKRLSGSRFLLNQISQSGTVPLNLLDGDMGTALTARDTLEFDIRGSISGTAGVKSIVLQIYNSTDGVVIPLLRKDFAAATTGAFVVHGSLYIAQLALMVSEMDVFTSAGSVREMLQGASVVSITGKSVSLQIIAICAQAADGMTFQKFRSELTNPMLI